MIYKKIFLLFSNIFDLSIELKKTYRPEGVKNWGLSEYADMVHELYVTNYTPKSKHGIFSFWVHHEDEDTVYKMALKRAIKYLVWIYKIRFNKWLK